VAALTASGSTITLLIGTVLLRLTVTGTYRRYVRDSMGPWLAIAGVTVVVLGIVTLVYALRRSRKQGDPELDVAEGHEHADGIRVGWLLLAPIAVLLLVAPPTLGSYGVDRGTAVNVRSGGAVFDPLPPGSHDVSMTLLEYGQRAFDRHGSSLTGATVQLTGFISRIDKGGFRLARYQIACCAADAVPAIVLVQGVAGHPPHRDSWVRVTGTYLGGPGDLPRLAATSIVEIPVPDEPYE
jgi:uncharacterized repeat protein (TIGR03943 family)